MHKTQSLQPLSRVRIFAIPWTPLSPGSSVHGILQARIFEWVAIPSPWDLPDPGIKTGFPTLQADSLPAEPPGNCQTLQQDPVNIWLQISILSDADAQDLPLGTSPVAVSGDEEALGPHSVETSPSVPTHGLCRLQQMMTQYRNLVLQHQV